MEKKAIIEALLTIALIVSVIIHFLIYCEAFPKLNKNELSSLLPLSKKDTFKDDLVVKQDDIDEVEDVTEELKGDNDTNVVLVVHPDECILIDNDTGNVVESFQRGGKSSENKKEQ